MGVGGERTGSHTPTSFDYKNGSVTNEQIVEGLKKAGVSAVAITDHHVIDVLSIRTLQKLGGKRSHRASRD
jgi:predicted metal-dependent phosphoesterase TrpH